MIRNCFALLLGLSVLGCSYSETQTRVPESRPAIAVRNAPEEAVVSVDGRILGAVSQFFHGDQVLRLEPGTHKVAIINQGQTLLSEKVFLGDGEVRTLIVPGGAQ